MITIKVLAQTSPTQAVVITHTDNTAQTISQAIKPVKDILQARHWQMLQMTAKTF